ncbi:MAG: hypothetical protein WAZ30_07430 [Syntrophorhabdus sp.]
MNYHFKKNAIFIDEYREHKADCPTSPSKNTLDSHDDFNGHEDYITAKDLFIDNFMNKLRILLFPVLLVKSVVRLCSTVINNSKEYLEFHLTKGSVYDLENHQKDV